MRVGGGTLTEGGMEGGVQDGVDGGGGGLGDGVKGAIIVSSHRVAERPNRSSAGTSLRFPVRGRPGAWPGGCRVSSRPRAGNLPICIRCLVSYVVWLVRSGERATELGGECAKRGGSVCERATQLCE